MSTQPSQGVHNLVDDEEENYEEQSPRTSSLCACFNFCWPKTRKYSNLTGPDDDHHQSRSRTSPDSWLVEKLKNIKETTESIAGPEFKTSVRKIGGYFTKHKQRNKNRNKMQYDAYNYALNFDCGGDDDDYDENVGFSRFPATPLLDDRGPAGTAAGRSESL